MVRPRRIAATLAAVLCLGAPAVALAQSAGDEQYSDPLAGANTTTSQSSGSGSSSGSGTSSGSGSDSLGQTPPSTSGGTSSGSSGSGSSGSGTSAGSSGATTTPATTPQTQSGQLPNTGADAWLVALLGGALLLGGVGLRLRARDGRF